LANPELGAKQICPTCSTKFYDLTRRPAVCPKCAAEFDPEEAIRNRRVRARAVLPDDDVVEAKVVKADESEDGFEAEVEEAAELDETIPVEPLDTEDAETDGAPATSDDTIGVDFAEDEDLEDADDDEVPFLEEEDEDFPEDEIDGLPEEGDRDD
jgi:uncharacterized protein (TIGR02300 family)